MLLLCRVREFMSQQMAAREFPGLIGTARKHDMGPACICASADGPRRSIRHCVGMDANMRKSSSEARLEERACDRIEWLSRRAKYLVHYGRRLSDRLLGRSRRLSLNFFFFFLFCRFAKSAFTADLRRPRRDGGESRTGHAHDLVSNTIRLMLKRIADPSDNKLCLFGACRRKRRACRVNSVGSVRRKHGDLAEIP